MENALDQVSSWMPLIISTGKAVIFLIIGFLFAGAISRFIRRKVEKNPKLDNTLGIFFASVVRYVLLTIVVIGVLGIFGFQVTSLVAILGAASLSIGLAMQGTLSDIAAGVMLIFFRPYKVGDFVDIAGTSGTVKDLNIFTTELATPDNVQIIVPNGKSWGSIITNFSAHDTRRVDFTFGIDYGDDIEQAMKIIRDVVSADERVFKDPAPWVRVVNLGDSSVDLGVRIWSTAADYWDIKFEMTRNIKEAFDNGGISIPYPHQVEIRKSA
ncbi:MAG: mechanosensitive ion channel protein [marine bacterium B5-7]|nr:MAG: mechanosensitive ion channel protein [marine bacterium B5-7]